MDNIQKHKNCINIPLSLTFGSCFLLYGLNKFWVLCYLATVLRHLLSVFYASGKTTTVIHYSTATGSNLVSPLNIIWINVKIINSYLQTSKVIHTQLLLNYGVGCNRDTLSTNFCKSSLVDELSYTLQVRVAPCHVRFTDAQHVYCGLEIQKFYEYCFCKTVFYSLYHYLLSDYAIKIMDEAMRLLFYFQCHSHH